ncbi:MAG: carboxypeptidase M32 [Alphaproteobacteria bacterium]|nr:carboxypeptidase M32 [Alphaproteobacteria bacterium]
MTSGIPHHAYDALRERFRRISALEDALSVLSWDRQTIMPSGGGEARAEQMATLQVLKHEAITAPDMADLLEEAGNSSLEAWDAANIREMRRDHVHATAVTGALVDAKARAAATSETAWLAARPAGDFGVVAKPLETLLGLVREVADAKADALGKSPYDALLDQFEPDGSAECIDALFGRLEPALHQLLPEVLEHQARDGFSRQQTDIPLERQRALGLDVMASLGFDFDHGRLDVSAHPFSGGVPDDVRITTRYDTADWAGSLMGVIHETGHALYERGLPVAWRGQPVGKPWGMVVHESQSLLMEMQVSRSRAFFDHAAPLIQRAFDVDGHQWTPEPLYQSATRVSRSLIRVEADEVTYPFHVIIRYRLERAMLSGDLAVADLPEAWNESMQANLGVRPPDDRLGCLQDIHWYDGAFGYFPTYTMGALGAAQLFAAAAKDVKGLNAQIAAGDFATLLAWLGEKVHRWGSYHDTDALMEQATGTPLGEQAFLAHIRDRYLSQA